MESTSRVAASERDFPTERLTPESLRAGDANVHSASAAVRGAGEAGKLWRCGAVCSRGLVDTFPHASQVLHQHAVGQFVLL